MAKQLRLDKYLADMGIGTRSEIKEWIRQGRVSLKGEICRKPEAKVDISSDEVLFDNQAVVYASFEYYMLHKPAGVVSATTDKRSTTVLDLITDKQRKDLFPVGRLDKDTEGLLLITNDGELSHNLLSPKKHVDKIYYAKVRGKVTEEDKQLFQTGVDIGDPEPTLPAELTIIKSGDISEIELILREGRFHQVKRMFEAVGKEVIYLKRISMGSLTLDPALKPGEYRSLTPEEIQQLKGTYS